MKKKISYVILLVATVIWGFAFVAQKAAIILPPFTVCAARSIIATLFLIAIIPLTDRITQNGRKLLNEKRRPDITREEFIGGAILGVILTAASAFQQAALSDTDAGKAAFITTLYIVFVPLFSAFLGKRPKATVLISIPVSIIGFYLLCIKPGVGIAAGDLMVLACALIFSGHIIVVDKFSAKCDGVRLSLVQFAVSSLLNVAIGLIADGIPKADVLLIALPSLLFLGIGSSGIAYTLQIIGQKGSDPAVASLILSMESVFAVIGAAIVLGERLSTREYIGCAVVLVAVILAQADIKFSKNDNTTQLF